MNIDELRWAWTQVVPILITFPIGRALARTVPQWRLLGVLHLNPGPFTIKEHVCSPSPHSQK